MILDSAAEHHPAFDQRKPEEMPECPAIGCDGRLTQRTSRWGKPFFSCSNYPDCDVIGNAIDQVINNNDETIK